jgi:hydrogenase nickel incorporation protein HypA/HybF
MHEMGIASSILEAVRKETLLYPGYRVAKVELRIGPFAGVDPESLRFCFDAIVKDSPHSPLELGIESSTGDELDLSRMELEEVNA